jgi:O-antigen ligase
MSRETRVWAEDPVPTSSVLVDRSLFKGKNTGWADVVGFGLFALLILWLVLTPVAGFANAFVILFFSGLAFGVSRLVRRRSRLLVPIGVILLAGFFAVRFGSELLDSHPLSGPFRYVNATGTLFAVAAIASLMLASASERVIGKVVGLAAAVAFAVVPVTNGSVAASIMLVIVFLVGLTAIGPRASRAAILMLTLLVIGVLGFTVLKSSDPAIRTSDGLLARSLSQRRLILWNDAYTLMRERQANGVWFGGFSGYSDAAKEDAASPWAHHEFLQMGAETGVPGVVLLASLAIWVLVRIWMNPLPDRYAVWGTGAFALLCVIACIDAVLHFAHGPLAAAALAGSTVAGSRALATGEEMAAEEFDEPTRGHLR